MSNIISIAMELKMYIIRTKVVFFNQNQNANHTLAEKGVKKVESVAQSTSAIAHSYTMQSVILVDGRLLFPFLIVLKESNGTIRF